METLKNLRKKVSQCRKKPTQKNFWSKADLEPTSFCLADLENAYLNSMPSASSLNEVSESQLIKLMKSVTSLVLKKEVTTIVCVFLRKAPTNNRRPKYQTVQSLKLNRYGGITDTRKNCVWFNNATMPEPFRCNHKIDRRTQEGVSHDDITKPNKSNEFSFT